MTCNSGASREWLERLARKRTRRRDEPWPSIWDSGGKEPALVKAILRVIDGTFVDSDLPTIVRSTTCSPNGTLRLCHVRGPCGPGDGPIAPRDEEDQLQRVSLPARDHPSSSLASISGSPQGDAQKQVNQVLDLPESAGCGIPVGEASVYSMAMIDESLLRVRYELLRSSLDERGRRLSAAAEAKAAGYGGITAAARGRRRAQHDRAGFKGLA